MDKFSRFSHNLCLSCAYVAHRSGRSAHLAEKRFCFSTVILKANNNVGLEPVERSPQCRSMESSRVEGLTFTRSFSQPPSSQHTLSCDTPCYGRFSGLYLRNTKRAGNASVDSLPRSADLLLGSHSMQSVRLYSTSPPQQPPTRSSKTDFGKSPISWKTLLAVAGVGCVIVIGVNYLKQEKENERAKARNRLLGKAKLGGDWVLTDHHGNRRSSKDFHGQWLLIYFGFTHCPDVCPEEIEKIVEVINKTDANKDLPKIQPIVITVDPDRDTPEALKEYCTEFSPRLLGFTGSSGEIQQATHAYRVYFSAGPKDDDSDYIVDHSIISYLINPQGEFVDYYGQNKTVSEMYNSIQLHIGTYLRKEKAQAKN